MSSTRIPIKLPPAEYLREIFLYDPETGSLTYRTRPKTHFARECDWSSWNGRFAGKPTGTPSASGHISVGINNKRWYAHRVIYKIMTGEDPPVTVDHRDGNKSDNRWEQLRPANYSEQVWNTRVRSDNTSGYRGVNRFGGKWRAYINIKGTYYHIGLYATCEEANAAYEAKARELFGEFYREE